MTLVLSSGEREHPLWRKLAAHMNERLVMLRAKNDGPLDEMQTATMRGQIKELKALMSLGTAAPVSDE